MTYNESVACKSKAEDENPEIAQGAAKAYERFNTCLEGGGGLEECMKTYLEFFAPYCADLIETMEACPQSSLDFGFALDNTPDLAEVLKDGELM